MTKYRVVSFRWGNDTDQEAGGGAYFTNLLGKQVYANMQIGVVYNLNGKLVTGTLQVVSGTEVKLLYGTNTPRLRQVVGHR